MTRHAPDYSPFGYSTDPMSGDPEAIGDQVLKLNTIQYKAGEAVLRLAKVSAAGQKSERLDAIVDDVRKVSGQLQQVEFRYDAARAALGGYLRAFEPAQQQADQIVSEHLGASREEKAHAGTVWELRKEMALHLADPPVFDRLNEEYHREKQQRDAKRQEIAEAKAHLKSLIQARHTAGDIAAAEIRGANGNLNDSIKDHLDAAVKAAQNWIKDNAENLKLIGDILGKISILLSLAALVFPVLAPFAAIAGIAGGIFSGLGAYGEYLKDGDGNKLAGELFFAGLSIFAGARVLGKVGKLMASGKSLVAASKAATAVGSVSREFGHKLGKGIAGARVVISKDASLSARAKGLWAVYQTARGAKGEARKAAWDVINRKVLGISRKDSSLIIRVLPKLDDIGRGLIDQWASQPSRGSFPTQRQPAGAMS